MSIEDISSAIVETWTADTAHNGFAALDARIRAIIKSQCDAVASQIFANIGSNFYPASYYRHLAAGNVDGFREYGSMGGGIDDDGSEMGVYIVGSLAAATLASGAQTGTAGAGTGSTSLVKPAGAADWTAGDLVGHFLQVVSGGGAAGNANRPTIRPIRANTTTNVTIDAITGLDATTVFAVVDAGSTIQPRSGGSECVLIANNQAPVVLRHVKFAAGSIPHLVHSVGNTRVVLEGCDLSAIGDLTTVFSERDQDFEIRNCIMRGGAFAHVVYCSGVAKVENVAESYAAGILIEKSAYGRVAGLVSDHATGYALKASGLTLLEAEVVANDGAGFGVILESVVNFTALPGRFLTGAGNTAWGLSIDRFGQYNLAGCDVTGALGDIFFCGYGDPTNPHKNHDPLTWANLTHDTYGYAEEHAAAAIARTGYFKSIKYGDYTYNGNIEVGQNFLVRGYSHVSLGVGENYPLTAAGTTRETAAHLDGPEGGAYACRGFAEIYLVDDTHQGVVLPEWAEYGGVRIEVANMGEGWLTVWAPTGGSISEGGVGGLDSTTIGPGHIKAFMTRMWTARNGDGSGVFGHGLHFVVVFAS